MKNILLITYLFQNTYNNNSSTFFWDYAFALKKAGYNVCIISIIPISIKDVIKSRKIDFGFKSYTKSNIKVYTFQVLSFPFLKRINYYLRFFFGKKIFLSLIKNNWRPDLIHVHSFLSGHLPVWIKNNFNINYIITEHNSGFYFNYFKKHDIKIAYKLYSNSISNYAVSYSFTDYLNANFNSLNNKFKYFPNIIDVNLFNLIEDTSKDYDFINVGNLNKNKNHLLLIKSFVKAFPEPSSKKLIIIGNGTEKKLLNKFIISNNLTSRVLLKGSVAREKISYFLNSSNFFISTSLHETFGVSIIEAMSCGLPVISTFSGGPESIIVNNNNFKNGLLCDMSEEDIKQSMIDIYDLNFDRNKIRNNIKENFSYLNYVSLIKSIIKKL